MVDTNKRALLALEDGRTFWGVACGYSGETQGEVVFNTSLTGYQEILTDPSYCGQLVAMTYPHIGNYGLNSDDPESSQPALAGLIVKECCRQPSNWRSETDLQTFLIQHQIVAIAGVDTRALTRHIREQGAIRGVISTEDLNPERLVQKARATPSMQGRDLVRAVSRTKPLVWRDSYSVEWQSLGSVTTSAGMAFYRVVVYDFGVKANILRCLASLNCRLTIVPAATPATEVLAMQPHGVLLSNGPGDPAAVGYAIKNVKKLLGKVPLFGICLGHQILGLALGGRTFKLKFGHHGGNHPVQNLLTGRIEITAQNHGFAVDFDSLDPSQIELTHVNLNDGTVEGMRHRHLPVFSVQYHPEAAPGPHDSLYLFREFIELMRAERYRQESNNNVRY
ncbi:MAG: glutamine-hydrolyzing carbamoyl-phosphate synthase small subunit [candidate division KSB1 bacterium]|nr:glutamine-hydrolyzing carbamoyl-phosphate synthase small subunit [candidate division KSB1 bacterium]MDZ7318074.1 glutamine-hydrolyzing carbamoyl-phosphate synthase small subunit [candidate division KSB1 bacterium]MDZ7340444.1 glutamine-hydrolyzing carbamoyl-phosphate synthase small subunit [candidate division KSB1 bacterium]